MVITTGPADIGAFPKLLRSTANLRTIVGFVEYGPRGGAVQTLRRGLSPVIR